MILPVIISYSRHMKIKRYVDCRFDRKHFWFCVDFEPCNLLIMPHSFFFCFFIIDKYWPHDSYSIHIYVSRTRHENAARWAKSKEQIKQEEIVEKAMTKKRQYRSRRHMSTQHENWSIERSNGEKTKTKKSRRVRRSKSCGGKRCEDTICTQIAYMRNQLIALRWINAIDQLYEIWNNFYRNVQLTSSKQKSMPSRALKQYL